MKLYFAYGSNLNLAQMSRRCPGAEPVSRATLAGWRIEYRYHLTIVPDRRQAVIGGLWLLDGAHELHLDRYEGYPRYYSKQYIEVQSEELGEVVALVYIMNGGKPEAPSAEYLQVCTQGARDWGIPTDYIRAGYRLHKRVAAQ